MTGFQIARSRPNPTLGQALHLALWWNQQADNAANNDASRFVCWQEESHWRSVAHELERQRQMQRGGKGGIAKRNLFLFV